MTSADPRRVVIGALLDVPLAEVPAFGDVADAADFAKWHWLAPHCAWLRKHGAELIAIMTRATMDDLLQDLAILNEGIPYALTGHDTHGRLHVLFISGGTILHNCGERGTLPSHLPDGYFIVNYFGRRLAMEAITDRKPVLN